ncbi:MAG: citramalate synthase [Inquilinus limosus]|uniref:(R)-citramalate synthase n=1 Tax=Inquilinus limosus TaxID=171674 RepID=A0A952FQA3_9PROT|nr:citramalate synthase [Inquilinus limosus]
MSERIWLFDTTLRDGAQTQGVDFSVADKIAIAKKLDALGIDYVEGGWPGANPTDDALFRDPPKLAHARFTAFGMTRRPGRSAANDPGLSALLNSDVQAITIVGKTWDFHVDVALNIPREENLELIRDSVAEIVGRGREAGFDCEHFFDGYKANPDYALACAKAAYEAGARWVVLCDTNGGALPHEVSDIVTAVARHIPGERCGNANLITLIPTLALKMGYETGVTEAGLASLTDLSHWFDERLDRTPQAGAPYVGGRAFAHKGGLHVSAIAKDPRSYEHVAPERVGNRRHLVVSDQAGRANILARFAEIGVAIDPKDRNVDRLVDLVKQREFEGYSYDTAAASFELLARRMLGQVPAYFAMDRFTVVDERRFNARGEVVQESEATVLLRVGDKTWHEVSFGNGPVNALDNAMRKALEPIYPGLKPLRLVDFKVRILRSNEGTGAMPRVMIETEDADGTRWSTIGVSTNVIDASFEALGDSFTYALLRAGATAPL